MYLECHREGCTWEGGQANMEWSGPHIKATCPVCNGFIKFVKQDRIDHGDMRKLAEWQQEQVDEVEPLWVMARYSDGTEEQVGEVEFRNEETPEELEIDGVVWKPEL